MFGIVFDTLRQCYPYGDLEFASTALRTARKDEDKEIVSLLGPYVNLNSSQPMDKSPSFAGLPTSLFSEAVRSRNINIIRTLLACVGDPNSPTIPFRDYIFCGNVIIGRWTPFLDAIASDDVIVVKLLHEAGANINDNTVFGTSRTPLQLAVEIGNLEVIDYLLNNGAEVNAPPCIRGGATAHQFAAIKGNVGLTECLIQERGADTNAPACRFQGRTALEGAAEHARLDMLAHAVPQTGRCHLRRRKASAKSNGFCREERINGCKGSG